MQTNRLINEISPYLRQHATNPVDWYPWGEEAFAKAKMEDKPVFLSIGYSVCHWCHVMARESFEDKMVAEILNREFVSIKVDREERPDIDGIYMEACQLMTGSGGWPLSAFLTCDQQPFFVGTYFPKESKYGMPSFSELLNIIISKWKSSRTEILASAQSITFDLGQESSPINTSNVIQSQYMSLEKSYDKEYGGFGNAPKFPMPSNLLFLFQYGKVNKSDNAKTMFFDSIDAMHRGGIYDHIGGGFARYSTDRKWLVPHFEKMLYDNAQLLGIYALAYSESKNDKYKEIVAHITDWFENEMYTGGGLYSARDADSGGGEGLFYLFTPKEIEGVLGKERGDLFCKHFDITARGNFEGKNIPNLIGTRASKLGSSNGISKADIDAVYQYRNNRMTLHTDDKYLSFWNLLAVSSFAKAYKATLMPKYLVFARDIYSFVQAKMTDDNMVYTSYKDGKRSKHGLLDDVASYIQASIELYQCTYERDYLVEAERRVEQAFDKFWDKERGGFYFTSIGGEKLIVRRKECYDGVTPSGNSMMYESLVYLSNISDKDKEYEQKLDSLQDYIESKHIYSLGNYCYAKLLREQGKKVVCVLPDHSTLNASANYKAMLFDYEFATIVTPSKQYPLKDGKPTFYVCASGICHPATNNLALSLVE